MRGSPGTSPSATPATTSTIEGAVLSRRAITAATTSTARNKSRTWMVAVMRLQRARCDVYRQRQQRSIEDERYDAVPEHGAADGLGAHSHVGNLRAHPDHEREIEEVPVVRLALVTRELHADPAALVVVFVRVV